MKRFFLVTIDCDLRCDDLGLRQASLEALLEVFRKAGLRGKITWFLNENDFALTRQHASFLKQALANQDTLALHDHLDWLAGDWDRGKIKKYCGRSRQTVERWLARNGGRRKISIHRTGCLFQHPAVYRALQELDYKIVSDIYPGYRGLNHTRLLACDNRLIPDGIRPYRHDAENFLDFQSAQGWFLQIPSVNMGLNPHLYPKTCLDFQKVSAWLRLAEMKKLECCALSWIFHPYEIMNTVRKSAERTRLDQAMLKLLEENIARCVSEYKLEFVNMEECGKAIKKNGGANG